MRNPEYRLLWSSGFFLFTGRWIQQVVVGWLVLDMTNSPWQVALIGFYQNVPNILGPFSGIVGDRLDRRRLVLVAQTVNVLVAASLTLLVASGALQLWHVVVASLIWGFSWALDFPSRRSLIMDLVGGRQLPSAMVLESTSVNMTKVVGPLLGGLLIEWLGYKGAFSALAFAYLLALLAVLLMHSGGARSMTGSESPWHNLVEGIRHVAGNRTIVGVLAITVAANTFAFPYVQLLPVFARDVLGVGPSGYGLLTAAPGVGSVIGSLLFVSFSRLTRYKGLMFIAGAIGLATSAFLFSFSRWYYLSLLLLFAGGIVLAGYTTMQSTLVLISAEEAVRGRALGILMLAIGTQPLGMLQMGGLANWIGAPIAVGLSTMLCLVLVAFFTTKIPELRRQQ